MKKLAIILGMAAIIALPTLAQAREVTITTQLQNYRGDGAYLAQIGRAHV